jgi:putative FmdB family regulatory protein
MPIYEYRCNDCAEDFEALVRSMSSNGDVHCPSCGSSQVKKAISLFGAATGGSRGTGSPALASGPSCGPVG